MEAHADALDRFLALGGGDFDARAAAALADVGLAGAGAREVGRLSGGEAARVALAAILLARFDLFCLDEPTNNLDFAGLDRLERFLDGLRAGVVLVSHDRAFLDRTVTRVVELEAETRRVHEYAGSWTDYEHVRRLAREQQERAVLDVRRRTRSLLDVAGRPAESGTRRRLDGEPPRHAGAALEGEAGEAPSGGSRAGREALVAVAAAAVACEHRPWWQPRRRAGRGSGRARLVPARADRLRAPVRRAPCCRRAERLRQVDVDRRTARASLTHAGHAPDRPIGQLRRARPGSDDLRRNLVTARLLRHCGGLGTPSTPAPCWRSSHSAPTTSPGPPRRCLPASAPAPRSHCSPPGA